MSETVTTSDMWLRTLASFAVDSPPTPTIYALPKAGHSGARLVMNSRSHCGGDIIARSIGMATKPHGGKKLESTRCHKPALWIEACPVSSRFNTFTSLYVPCKLVWIGECWARNQIYLDLA